MPNLHDVLAAPSRSRAIIAAIGLNLLAGAAFAVESAAPVQSGFSSYQVRLEITRNGILLGSPESIVATGASTSLELVGDGRSGGMLVQQRVTGFPGAGQSKVLLELEVYGPPGRSPRRIVAPTLGLQLGRPQLYQIRTEEGLVSIRATVVGLGAAAGQGVPAMQTLAYPGV